MLGAIYLGYAVNAGYIRLTLGDYRGDFNSAWIGTMVALTTAVFVSLVGFYIVRNSIARDRTTRVGQILAGTPMGTFTYLLAKGMSNFLVFSAIVAVQVAAALLMQLLGGESGSFEPGAMLLPFVYITLPALAAVSAVAVFFESVRWLSGGFGNVAYFILFNALMTVPLMGNVPGMDMLYITGVERSMHEGARAAYPEFKGGFQLQAGPLSLEEEGAGLKRFTWEGMDWTLQVAAGRFAWFGWALLIVLLAVPFFDRFDETRSVKSAMKRRRKGPGDGYPEAAGESYAGAVTVDAPETAAPARRERIGIAGRLVSIMTSVNPSSGFGRMLVAEVRLMLKGVHTFWFVAAAGLAVACLVAPAVAVKEGLLGAAWIWPVLIWSKMGMREEYHGTGQLLFSAPRIRTRQLFAVWGAGVALAAATGSGALVNFLLSGFQSQAPGVIAGMVFIPSLALALGVWSNGSKLFEVAYLFWWYIGPMHNIPELDFTGASSTPGIAAAYLGLSALLLLAALAGRKRQTSG
jgi:hypothetical protein